ncbi:MAG: Permease of the drug/metabolite transporter (DMT) superfamily [Pelagibacterales bacterium]|nr:Permease of the drug/metabolite transporter (DMT) superfamily [Pelagibacterales bacterium]
MTLLKKIPGSILVLIGAICLSFGGIIVKSFEGASLWQILFWRQFFFIIIVALYLLFTYKKNFFNTFYKSGIPGLIAGIFLGAGFASYVFAMYHTTVANTLFIITTETIFLAFFGYIFLKEKISFITFISILLGMFGVLMIVGSSLSTQTSAQFLGNIVAFIMPISFAVLIVIVRKYPSIDMIPAQFTAGVCAAIIGYLVAEKLSVSHHDLFLGFLAGTFQIGFGFILITIGSKTTPAAVVGIMMLTEAVLGPIWAWLFINEIPPIIVIVGGAIIIFAILFEFLFSKKKE